MAIGYVLGGLLGAGAAYAGYKLFLAPPAPSSAGAINAPGAKVPQVPIGAAARPSPNPLAYLLPKQAGVAPVSPPTPPVLGQPRTPVTATDPWAGIAGAGFAALPGVIGGVNSVVSQQQAADLAQQKSDQEYQLKLAALQGPSHQTWGQTTSDNLAANPDLQNPLGRAPWDLQETSPADVSPALDGYPYQETWDAGAYPTDGFVANPDPEVAVQGSPDFQLDAANSREF